MVPTFPAGVTIDSMLLAACRLRPDTYAMFRHQIHGKKYDPLTNLLARHVPALIQRAFGGLVSAEALVREHSVWPVFSRLLSEEASDDLFRSLFVGALRPEIPYFPLGTRGTWFGTRWRGCEDCARHDLLTCGVGHWRVVHQIPGVYHCPSHGLALFDCCGVCGHPAGGVAMESLPSDPCLSCGSTSKSGPVAPASPGLSQLSGLYVELFEGRGPEIDPASRAGLHRRLIEWRYAGERDKYVDEFIEHFRCRQLADVALQLGAAFGRGEIEAELDGGVRSCPPILQLAMVACTVQMLGPVDMGSVVADPPTPLSIDSNAEITEVASPVDRLLAAATRMGFSREAVIGRLNGRSVRELVASRVTSVNAWRDFRRRLPDDLRDLLPGAHLRWEARWELGLSPSDDELRPLFRARISEVIAERGAKRTPLLRYASGAYQWCLENDRDWLNEVCPSPNSPRRTWPAHLQLRRCDPPEEVQRVHRGRLVEIAALVANRRALYDAVSNSYKWCYRNDRAWLEATFDKESFRTKRPREVDASARKSSALEMKAPPESSEGA